MEKSNYPQLDEGLDEKVIGFDGKTGTTMTNLSKEKFEKLKVVKPKYSIKNLTRKFHHYLNK